MRFIYVQECASLNRTTDLKSSVFNVDEASGHGMCPDIKGSYHYNTKRRDVLMMRGCFSPLVFSACGGMGPTATIVYKKLAFMFADKWEMNYNRCLYWMKCRLCFSLLRSAIMCLRGHCSTVHCPTSTSIDLAYSEGRLNANALE